jgi:DNA end-binding protein Ku
MRGREYVVSLKPCGRGIVMETLRYSDEVHKAASYFRDIPDTTPDEDLLDLANTLIDKKSGKFEASDFHDRYVDALRDLIERKKKGKTITIDKDDGPVKSGSNVIDLMAALKKSLDGPGKKTAASSSGAAAKAPAKKPAAAKPAAAKAPAKKRA